ncbi:hypothetical protein FACS189490_14180 [Clostridia bacterium]|nr:hypothetical protein FACS189490_14180 [Clostridia bacterium]
MTNPIVLGCVVLLARALITSHWLGRLMLVIPFSYTKNWCLLKHSQMA